jgi:hypothetical protein
VQQVLWTGKAESNDRLFSQTLLLLVRKNMIDFVFTVKQAIIFEKRACKLNINAQNNFFYVKIGLWILTINFTKIALAKKGINKPII